MKFKSLLYNLKSLIHFVCQERKRAFGGFTLIELIVVIAIVGILSGIGIPAYNSYIEKAKVIRAISEIRMLEKEIMLYQESNKRLPDTLDDINRGNLEDPWGNPYQYLNFESISEQEQGSGQGQGSGQESDGGSGGKGKMRKDRFLVPINSDFDLYSMGKDGKSVTPLTAKASHDDIIRANDGQYIGIASEY